MHNTLQEEHSVLSVNSFIIVTCEKKISRALDKKLDKNLI